VNNALFTIGGNSYPPTFTSVYSSFYATTPNVKLNFTQITSTHVLGTFSGNVSATPDGTTILVSNGTFYLTIK